MAEQLKIDVKEDGCSLYIFDTTGAYKTPCNKGGWGTPNQKVSDAISASVDVYSPKSTTPLTVDLTGIFPNTKNIGYEFVPEDFGTEKIESGIWKFKYSVVTASGTITGESSVLVSSDLESRIDPFICSLDVSDPESEDSRKSISMLNGILNMKRAYCCEKYDQAQRIAEFLYNQLNCNCQIC